MTTGKIIGFIVILALTAYIPRMLPMAILRKRITNPFLQSFLLYMPYAILGAMLVPDMLFSTGSIYSALAGCAVAGVLAYFRKGLLPVALAATATVFIMEQLMALLIH